MRWIIKVLVVLCIIFCFSFASAATYYIDKGTGSDTNSGSSSSPWSTIDKANSSLRAGDTVIVGGGTYNEIVRPIYNGQSGLHITYRAKTGTTVVVTQSIDLTNKSYVTIDGIDVSSSFYVYMNGASRIILENMEMSNPAPTLKANNGLRMFDASYCIIRNNIITGTEQVYQDLIELRGNAHHNLIEGNNISKASHQLIRINGASNYDNTDPRYNIIRNNSFYNDYHHCNGVTRGAHHNVFEGNVYKKCGIGVTDGPGIDFNHGEAWHAWQPSGIYRFNKVTTSGGQDAESANSASFGAISRYDNTGLLKAKVESNRVYHNVFYRNYNLVFKLGKVGAVPYGDNKFKNNILFQNGIAPNSFGENVIFYTKDSLNQSTVGDLWSGNLIEYGGEKVINWFGSQYTISQAQSNLSAMFKQNIGGDPLFSNASSYDFSLKSGSPAIDKGVYLTTTSASGSGTVIPVQDAQYFIDGFGIVQGDTIQVGGASCHHSKY